jgi:hypothetical protein
LDLLGKLFWETYFFKQQQLHSGWTTLRPDPALECPASWQGAGERSYSVER